MSAVLSIPTSHSGNLLTVQGLADFLSVSPKTLRNWLSRGICPIPPLKIRGAVRFDRNDVANYIESLKPTQLLPASDIGEPSPRRGRGRPRKDLEQQPRG